MRDDSHSYNMNESMDVGCHTPHVLRVPSQPRSNNS